MSVHAQPIGLFINLSVGYEKTVDYVYTTATVDALHKNTGVENGIYRFCLKRASFPVSYTHLDVYKRQLHPQLHRFSRLYTP